VAIFSAFVAAHGATLGTLTRHMTGTSAAIASDRRTRLCHVPGQTIDILFTRTQSCTFEAPCCAHDNADVRRVCRASSAHKASSEKRALSYPLPPQLLHDGGSVQSLTRCPTWPHRMHAIDMLSHFACSGSPNSLSASLLRTNVLSRLLL